MKKLNLILVAMFMAMSSVFAQKGENAISVNLGYGYRAGF